MGLIQDLNKDFNVHGIIVQLPLPTHINESDITEAVDPRKDVDGYSQLLPLDLLTLIYTFHSENSGKLSKKRTPPLFVPCTPKGIMELLKCTGIDFVGKNAVVLGRSNIVRLPIASLLQAADATVTICHSKSTNIDRIVKYFLKLHSYNYTYRYQLRIL